MREVEAVVIGAGQAGLSAAHHLQRLVIDFVVLDANDGPGGAWRHRWDSLTMADVHGVADLPGVPAPDHGSAAPANVTVPAYFADYEQRFDLPVERPVRVLRVEAADADPAGPLVVTTTAGTWRTRSVVNATGTWDTPFIPHYPVVGYGPSASTIGATRAGRGSGCWPPTRVPSSAPSSPPTGTSTRPTSSPSTGGRPR